jgi:putative N6-adenine-specific DNA methylase
MSKEGEDIKLVATTFHGLEEVLAKELLRLGARDIEVHKRSVSFTGDKGFIYKANFCLRTALRILKPLATFTITDGNDLSVQAKAVEWDQYFGVDKSFVVDVVMNSELFANSMFPALKIKDGVVDYFRDKTGRRPDINKENPDIYIYAHIFKDRCTLAMDTSGEPLFKRGYRQDADAAPMSEVLAAGLVLISGWERHQPLVDFMCGSGTIPIEAALIAADIPPGCFRKKYAFQNWPDYDEALFEMISDAAMARIRENDGYIYGCDRQERAIDKAILNITAANVDDMIKVKTCDFRDFIPPPGRGVVIINPPYGERLQVNELSRLYESIGDHLKKNYQGYTAWIISTWQGAPKHIGLHASRKITLYNGPLECRLLKYELYDGSKKIKKQIDDDQQIAES